MNLFSRIRKSRRPHSSPTSPRRGLRLLIVTWLYFHVVAAVWIVMRLFAERTWPATVLLFAPRWLFLLPLIVLGVAAIRARRLKVWGAIGMSLLLVVGPLMNVSWPIRRWWTKPPPGLPIRIMTCNRGQKPLDVEQLRELVSKERIDVICFQEGNPDPKLDAYLDEGWHRDSNGKVASKLPIVEEYESAELPWTEYGSWPVRVHRVRLRDRIGREFVVASIHMPTMAHGFSKLRKGDRAGFHRYNDWRREQVRRMIVKLDEVRPLRVLVGGDFNMPRDSPMLGPLRASYEFAFEQAGWGYGYTRPTNLPWIPLDQILGSREWWFTRCRVGPDLGSDHLPLIAEAVLPFDRSGR